MTVSYSDSFTNLLWRWQGSLWKSIWQDLGIFLIIYYIINFVYRFALTTYQAERFAKLVLFCGWATEYIPLLFLLGFYVWLVVGRWWEQFTWVAWPDRFMHFLCSYLRGDTEELITARRTIARWCNLASVISWCSMSTRLFKRFPTHQHIVKSGLMTPQELEMFEATDAPYGKYWIPVNWAGNLLHHMKDRGFLDKSQLKQLIKELQSFKEGFGILMCFDWISVPLVYTQVVTIATYGYFAICLIGRQEPSENFDMYVPIFTILQFCFYMGWLKVGEDLMNPFGEDEDDFEMNYVLDRNVQIGCMLADDVYGQLPPVAKDKFWDRIYPSIPHTKGSWEAREDEFPGSLAGFEDTLSDADMEIIWPSGQEVKSEAEKEEQLALKGLHSLISCLAKRKREEIPTEPDLNNVEPTQV